MPENQNFSRKVQEIVDAIQTIKFNQQTLSVVHRMFSLSQ